ncbi:MAG: 50S ribosomal protein L3 [Cellvibrionales bacterium]|jgi:large subunit ribosomal protein L3|nr:50S ribosomal protein L3 [Cellvibrionales bacterium]MCH9798164.1 50S ribosomal protein L3 [Gammaproteobacteria bacterium]MDA7737559.1 50S ribosomal protein L3 [Porticoccus sp.]MBT7437726.1 50S ribosomal protein L3 [Cellvibrionales bacterium]MCH9843868.1 50S ribosomal protein L3 [Gammaproteobacteria bacterium]
MTIGIVGRKSGMTRVFNDKGASIPVTVVEVEPNRVTQIKTDEIDGYSAVQVTVGTRRSSRISKSEAGHFAKAGVEAGRGIWELRLDTSTEVKVGENIAVDQFSVGQKVDVTGISKGKGYAGVIKRWNFQMQDATHGNSLSHRAHGSTGQCQTPGRVWKGKKMSGHMGNEQVTTQNLEIVRIDSERNLLLIKGAVPGAPGGDVIVRFAEKS